MPIPYAGRVFTDEVVAAVSTLDFWLTLGKEGSNMERELSTSRYKKMFISNSGSSANLVAISALTKCR